ncbi:Trm112 family protein [Thermosulfurimonas sp. F29]|uniref:Trm112 family protein n=1 Tax=Thermosulfurimonas sp. F29 TaxID=2867247 RepID=UPI001C8345B6|nr:Trm112 family protein [Thermosulfurimonas sp. F29]MBX6422427.1 Trm112 family protein [Thermosulfurimonas sp. F29]
MAEVVPRELLELLACPRCKGEVEAVESPPGLLCRRCDLFYEVREGIPVMLVEEARRWSEVKGESSG